MLVCPNCRSENLEGVEACRVCGHSLGATDTRMRSAKVREPTEDELDIKPPPAPSAVRGIVALVLVGLGLVGAGLWFAIRPNPCQGKFASVLFAYCAEIPQGWRGGSQLTGEGNRDQFGPSGEEAAAWVRVEEIVPATTTQQYAQQFRTSQEADGLDPQRLELVEIDGEQAIGWDVTVAPADEADPIRLREVVVVREEGVWRITLAATVPSYTAARVAFDQLLDSWVWR